MMELTKEELKDRNNKMADLLNKSKSGELIDITGFIKGVE